MFPKLAAPETGQQEPDSDQILEALKPGLQSLIQSDIRADVDPEKVYQYADIRKHEFYWRGLQYLRKKVSDGVVVDWEPITESIRNADGSMSEQLYDYTINDIRGYGRKFIGVVAQQAPNVKAEPNKRTNEDHIRRARKADAVAAMLRGLWDITEINRHLAFGFWKSGTQFGHIPFVADGAKYGYTEEPEMRMELAPAGPATLRCVGCGLDLPAPPDAMPPRACPDCGTEFGPEDYREPEMVPVPAPSGMKRYANGCAEFHLYSGMYVTTPFYIRTLSDTPWLLLEYEEHRGKLLSAYAEREDVYARLKEMTETDAASGAYGAAADQGRSTRDAATSPNASLLVPRKNRWLYSRVWLRPAMYELAKQTVDIGGQGISLRDALMERFPAGLKVTLIQDKIVDLEPERIDDVWCMAKPETSENAYPDALCKDLISGQDLTNHCHNTTAETLERQIPQTFIDVEQIDIKARKKYQLPGGNIPVRRKSGMKIEDSIARVPVAKAEPEMVTYPAAVREHNAEIVNLTPQVYGAGEREQTAYATNLKRNQAMLPLTPSLDSMRNFIAKATELGIRQMARHSGGRIPSPYAPDSEAEYMELEDLLQGGWHIKAEDSMPMSWSERRVTLMELMEKNKESLGPLGFQEMENIHLLQDNLVGLPDWKLPMQNALDKVNNCIRKLLQGAPIQQIGMDGRPTLLPSIPVDEFEDDHQFSAQAVKNWAQDPDSGQREKEENPDGYANVIAWGKGHLTLSNMAAMAAQQQQPKGEKGAPPPPADGPPKKLMPPPGGDAPAASTQALQQPIQ